LVSKYIGKHEHERAHISPSKPQFSHFRFEKISRFKVVVLFALVAGISVGGLLKLMLLMMLMLMLMLLLMLGCWDVGDVATDVDVYFNGVFVGTGVYAHATGADANAINNILNKLDFVNKYLITSFPPKQKLSKIILIT